MFTKPGKTKHFRVSLFRKCLSPGTVKHVECNNFPWMSPYAPCSRKPFNMSQRAGFWAFLEMSWNVFKRSPSLLNMGGDSHSAIPWHQGFWKRNVYRFPSCEDMGGRSPSAFPRVWKTRRKLWISLVKMFVIGYKLNLIDKTACPLFQGFVVFKL